MIDPPAIPADVWERKHEAKVQQLESYIASQDVQTRMKRDADRARQAARLRLVRKNGGLAILPKVAPTPAAVVQQIIPPAPQRPYKTRLPTGRPITSDRGELWIGAKAAGAALKRLPTSIYDAIYNKHRCAGRMLWYVGQPPVVSTVRDKRTPLLRDDGVRFESISQAVGGCGDPARRQRLVRTMALGIEFEGHRYTRIGV